MGGREDSETLTSRNILLFKNEISVIAVIVDGLLY